MNKSPLFNELSVVIPVYNEEKRIKKSLKKIVSYLDNVCEKYEIIIVDDGSKDKTLAVINEVSNDHFRVIVSEKNRGKGYVVKRGNISALNSHKKGCCLLLNIAAPIVSGYLARAISSHATTRAVRDITLASGVLFALKGLVGQA